MCGEWGEEESVPTPRQVLNYFKGEFSSESDLQWLAQRPVLRDIVVKAYR